MQSPWIGGIASAEAHSPGAEFSPAPMQTLKLLSSAVLCTCSRRRGRASPNPRARSLPRAVAQPPSYHLPPPPPPRVPLTIHLVTHASSYRHASDSRSSSSSLRVQHGHLSVSNAGTCDGRWLPFPRACRARLLAYILGDDGEQQKQEEAGEAVDVDADGSKQGSLKSNKAARFPCPWRNW